MKKILYLFIITSISSFSQRTDNASLSQGKSGVSKSTQLGLNPLNNRSGIYGGVFWSPVAEEKINIKGDVYLFNNWLNKVIIHTINEKSYKLSNVNFNIKNNKIDAKFDKKGKEQIFSFDSNNIDKFIIKGREFCKKKIKIKSSIKNKLIEKLKVNGKIRMYKLHFISIQKGAFNPMTQSLITPNKYIKKTIYYLEKDGDLIKEVKLKKSQLFKFMNDKTREVKEFIKKNGLKLKKEKDVIKILNYYNSI